MEGERFSHYEIQERLGGGGMGVVYRALDTRLGRHVALKFLPPELTRDEDARRRFMQEARAASALDHPNICTIHEIDTTPDGQMFIAMAFYDGETLKKRIQRGARPLDEALDIAGQVARGLAKAHAAGIIHRDIKPANLMVTSDGFVKIVDFGIAKLTGVTGPTQDGTTLGTIEYMSPEQAQGEEADEQSDVWALGAVLYEMLTGQQAFRGDNPWALLNSIAHREPEAPRDLRPDIPEDVQEVVMRALRKERDERTPSADEFYQGINACRERLTGASRAAERVPIWDALRRPRVGVPVALMTVALGVLVAVSIIRSGRVRWAREEGVPEMLALIEQDDYGAAFGLAGQIEQYIPNDPILADALSAATVTGSIVTDPPGATIYVQPYSQPESEWRLLGQSPLDSVRLPRSIAVKLRVEADGYEPRMLATGVPGFYFGRASADAITLLKAGSVPPDMVFVPGGSYPVRITGFNSLAPIQLDPFLIDRTEVTNAEYKDFVDAGGYEQPRYWEGLEFTMDGQALSWDEAMDRFVDASGEPGPSTWEFGDYPDGQGDYPVSGVSWYEAVAYLRFRDKVLPTIYHWARAALEPHNLSQPLATEMIPLANFKDEGPMPVGASGAMGPHGTLDTAGNVKEWCWNASGEHRWLLGGAWDDDTRMHSVRFTSPPFDRSPRHGFRGMRYLDAPPPEQLTAPVDLLPRDYRGARPVSDEVYRIFKNQMTYVPSELDARVEETDDTSEHWTWEHVTLDAGEGDERFSLYLLLPKSVDPPYQTLIYFPGLGPFQTRPSGTLSALTQGPAPVYREGSIRSGRAIAWPVWNGSYERWDGFLSLTGEAYLRAFRDRMADWASELGRTIDYLETRDDIQADGIGFLGVSFGASTALPLLDLEDRLKAALLLLPGYTYRDVPPEADAVNYVPHTTLPVLMIGGRYDYVFPVETSARPLFDQLGTPPDQKRFILYDMGHGPFPRGQLLRDMLPWLDEALGPVE